MDVAEQLYTWFDAPVVLELVHERMSEEEAGLKAAHVSIADRVAINDLPLRHVLANFPCPVLVDERGI